MPVHKARDTNGESFEIVLDDDSRIQDVGGQWPDEGGEFEIDGTIPPHSVVTEQAPDHIKEYAAENGMEVCFYDPNGCRTCYCYDDGRMRCVAMC